MIDLLDEQIIRRLQKDIPITEEPYRIIANEVGIGEDELIDRIDWLHKTGVLKRVAAVVRHREVGFKANALVLWKVPEERVEAVGTIMASVQQISHCYERDTCENWKYNMYTMVHEKTRQQCEEVIKKLSRDTEVKEYRVLYSLKELKKSSMRY
ncbi:MAG: Lrp/AsnC family transcriptional regulator [Bacillota bacterium]|nr:Lrp/AsnC family transcriptional regulator [Bacillota bacterium]